MKRGRGWGAGILILFLAVTTVYAAPKEKNKDNGNGQKKEEIKAVHNEKHPVNLEPRINEHKKECQRIHAINRNKDQNTMRVYLPEQQEHKQQKYYRGAGHSRRAPIVDRKNGKKLLNDLEKALRKLEYSRWSYNPHDERGQGNMGRVDMIAPYGHDKDSDRMELYGNRGRVIRISEPIPEPEPAPEPPSEPEPPAPAPEPEPEPTPEPPPPPPF